MWLVLETGAARGLRRRHGVRFDLPEPERGGARVLPVEAAHTCLPEAALTSLPALARRERAAGLTGPVRTRLASTDPDDEQTLGDLRDELVDRLGGSADRLGALRLCDQVHLSRLVRGEVPAVVAASCVAWYSAYRSPADPHAGALADLRRLLDRWLAEPAARADVDRVITACAVDLVGADPLDLLVVA